MKSYFRGVTTICFLTILIVTFIPHPSLSQVVTTTDNKNGPFVDNLNYRIIEGDESQVLALQNNEIDIIGDSMSPDYLDAVVAASNIDVSSSSQNGYGFLTMNTAKYPYNVTDFRRALAFAINKSGISEDVWLGYAQPLDSCLPLVSPYTVEEMLDFSYIDAQPEIGNRLLNESGFDIDPETGYRMKQNGSPLGVTVDVGGLPNAQSFDIAFKIFEALDSLHIQYGLLDSYSIIERVAHHGDYDIAIFEVIFNDYDIDWLAYEYWSEMVNESYYNFPNWENATFDSYRGDLLNATDSFQILDAAYAMQEIWIHASPCIPLYEKVFLSAYRTNYFDGFVNDINDGVPCWWTNQKVHLNDDFFGSPWGGTFRWSTPRDVDSFNLMKSTSTYTWNVLQMLYDSLLRRGPDGSDILWLTETYTVETHLDNTDVPNGHTRFTFDILQNATWSDGHPLTAEDVAFSFTYYRDSNETRFGYDLQDLITAYAPTTYQVVVEFSTESFWNLHKIGFKPIIPMHFFDTLGLDGWDEWDPIPPGDSMITSGPFNISRYVAGEFIELEKNPHYYYTQLTTYCVTETTWWDGPDNLRGYLENGLEVTGYASFNQDEVWNFTVHRNAAQLSVTLRKSSCFECNNYYVQVRIYRDGTFVDRIRTYSSYTIEIPTPNVGEWVFRVDGIRCIYNLTVQVDYDGPTTTTSSIGTSTASETTPVISTTTSTSITSLTLGNPSLTILLSAVTAASLAIIAIFSVLIIKHRRYTEQ